MGRQLVNKCLHRSDSWGERAAVGFAYRPLQAAGKQAARGERSGSFGVRRPVLDIAGAVVQEQPARAGGSATAAASAEQRVTCRSHDRLTWLIAIELPDRTAGAFSS